MSKPFVCVCVEGPTDQKVLEDPLRDLFYKRNGDDVLIEFRTPKANNGPQGDLTSFPGATPENIEKLIYKYYFRNYTDSLLDEKDLTYLVHIIDLDGCFVQKSIQPFSKEEERLADGISNSQKPASVLYFDDHIAVRPNNIDYFINTRNPNKRKIMEYLNYKDTVIIGKKSVKYRLFYFSSNIDHFLHNKANLSGREKMQKASIFADEYIDGDLLAAFFLENPYCPYYDYESSWKEMWKRDGAASLMRGSNINLLIEMIQKYKPEDWG